MIANDVVLCLMIGDPLLHEPVKGIGCGKDPDVLNDQLSELMHRSDDLQGHIDGEGQFDHDDVGTLDVHVEAILGGKCHTHDLGWLAGIVELGRELSRFDHVHARAKAQEALDVELYHWGRRKDYEF